MTTIKQMYDKGYRYLTSVTSLTLKKQTERMIVYAVNDTPDSHAFFKIISINGQNPPDEALVRKCIIQVNWGELRGIAINFKERNQNITQFDHGLGGDVFLSNGETIHVELILQVDYVYLEETQELSDEDFHRIIRYYATFWTDGRMPKRVIEASCLNEELEQFYDKLGMEEECNHVMSFMQVNGFRSSRGLEKDPPKEKVSLKHFSHGGIYEVSGIVSTERIGTRFNSPSLPDIVANFRGIEASGLGVDIEYDSEGHEITHIEVDIEGRHCVFHLRPDHTLRDLADGIMREALRPAVRALIHDALYLSVPTDRELLPPTLVQNVNSNIQLTPALRRRFTIPRRNRGNR